MQSFRRNRRQVREQMEAYEDSAGKALEGAAGTVGEEIEGAGGEASGKLTCAWRDMRSFQ